MKIHSLKLTIQDTPDKKGELFAGVFGTLVIDTGEVAMDADGVTPKLDAEKQQIPILDDINFAVALNQSKELKTVIQELAIQALTLKDMQVAKKNGQLSHYIEKIKALAPKKRGNNRTPKKKK